MNVDHIAIWGVSLSAVEAEQLFRTLNATQYRQSINFQAISEVGFSDALAAANHKRSAPLLIFFSSELSSLRKHLHELLSTHLTVQVYVIGPAPISTVFDDLMVGRAAGETRVSPLNLEAPNVGISVENALTTTLQRRKHRASIHSINSKLQSFQNNRKTEDRRRSISDFYLESFLAQADDAFIALDVSFNVVYWSRGAHHLFELVAEDALGRVVNVLPFWNPSLTEELLLTSRGETVSAIVFNHSDSKRQRILEARFSSVQDGGGDTIGISLIIRDVTERERKLDAERAAQNRTVSVLESERLHLHNIFKQAPGFIAVTAGANHVFELANDAYLDMVGGDREIIGKPAAEALPELQGQEFLTLLDQVSKTGEVYIGRAIPVTVSRRESESETRFVDFVFHPIIEGDGAIAGIFCLGADITEHKLAKEQLAMHQANLEKAVAERTEELNESQHALHQSQKLEAIGKLTGGIAHDFNNVMQIISSSLQLMAVSPEEEKPRYILLAEEAVKRASKLSSDLLAFARKQPLSPVVVNLGRVLRDMDNLLRHALGEMIEIETIVGGGLWNTVVDVHQLENVILNLCINARDAMPSGGKLTLEVGNASLDYHYVKLEPGLVEGQYIQLAITDTGTGMPPEVVAQAFDPFFTTKKEGEGTGLGLSMAYGFTKQSCGHIKIYSEVGHGTTFKLYLPRSLDVVSELTSRYDGPVIGGTETILVVEDDLAVRETAVQMLSQLGYLVLQAYNGQSAIDIVNSGAAIDLIFTDVVMPGTVKCTELAARAKEALHDVIVLFTSGYTQNAIVHGGRLDPGVELLSKPYSRVLLAGRIRQLLDARRKDEIRFSSESSSDPEKLRILVVEDDKNNRQSLCDILQILNHEPTGAASSEEALIELENSTWDIVITDLSLPGMPGNELAKLIHARWPSLKIIICSGYGFSVKNDIPSDCELLPKPYSIENLVALLTLS